MVALNRMLEKKLSASKLVMIQLVSKLTISTGNKNGPWTVNSLTVKSDAIGANDFARLCIGVPIADKIDRKQGQSEIRRKVTLLILSSRMTIKLKRKCCAKIPNLRSLKLMKIINLIF